MSNPPGYHTVENRPNKDQVIRNAFQAAAVDGCLQTASSRNIIYYTLGGIQFTDLIRLYNICGETITAARSFEQDARVLPVAQQAAIQLAAEALGGLDLQIIYGDIFESTFREVPRNSEAIVLFLDLQEMLLPHDEKYFREWVTGKCLLPGDIIFLTSCVHPWLTSNKSVQAVLQPILGSLLTAGGGSGPVNYVPALITYFSSGWTHYGYSSAGFRHFFAEIYKDTKFDMALNAFVLV